MRLSLLLALLLVPVAVAQPAPSAFDETYGPTVSRIIEAALADSAAYDRLAYLSDRFGHRLSGSQSLEEALDWVLETMRADGLENVRGQPVLVPHWVRGEESAVLVEPVRRELAMLGLGGSIGTPPEGITAEVLVVGTFEELEARQAEVAGRIVLFNAPFTNYGETVRYRIAGAAAAARYGAVASLIRSVGPFSMQTPHTGTSRYQEGLPEIPHAALAIEGAELLQRWQDRGERPVVTLKMEAHTLPDAMSRNAIAELRGRERPDEIVVVGGHIDSWDVGDGAMDDGGGSVVAWEAVRLLKALGLRPRRTLRVVLWTNEENGLRGALAYRDSVVASGEIARHVLALESDGGVFAPVAIGVTASDEAFARLAPLAELLAPVVTEDARRAGTGVVRGGGGADIGPLMAEGVPGAALVTANDRYFWYHHSAADTVDKLDAAEVQRCVAVVAAFLYVVGELPDASPRG